MIRSIKFWVGLTILSIFIFSSFGFALFYDSDVRQVQMLYDDDKNLIGGAPFEPSLMFPLGTDPLGYDISQKVLQGAKFTLLAVIAIGVFRVLFSFIVAIPFAFYLPEKIRRGLDQLLSSFYFIPLTIIAVFILSPILSEQLSAEGEEFFLYTFTERIGLEVIILTFLVVPLLGSMIGNMMASLLKEEFIEGARLLGASRWRIFTKHVIPHMLPKLVIVWCQQCVQVLIIFTHLGYFKLFFGGTDMDFNPMMADPPKSLSNEWSGLVGDYYIQIHANPYIALGPIIMFGIAIYAFQLIGEGFQHHLQTRHYKKEKRDRMSRKQNLVDEPKLSFDFMHKRGA
ncbi:ABC transporter permease [Fictibacillus phosphorivorans]|uniref:ABC transporter permease n=1 Tax=Fictibacillus phosphorivorans TaxID=1221500 RepID=UPI0011A6F3BE|nr:ABC transporter permease subunit [Fictibacillus phosphorivorans]